MCVRVYAYVCLCMFVSVCLLVSVCVYINVCMLMCVSVCMCVGVCGCVCWRVCVLLFSCVVAAPLVTQTVGRLQAKALSARQQLEQVQHQSRFELEKERRDHGKVLKAAEAASRQEVRCGPA